jgi:hypothetical protein
MMRAKRLMRTWLVSLALVMALASIARAQNPEPPTVKPIPPLPYKSVDERQGTGAWKRFQFGDPLLFSLILPQPPKTNNLYTTGSDGGVTTWYFVANSLVASYGAAYSIYDEYSSNPGTQKTEAQKRAGYNNFAAGFVNGLLQGTQAAEGERGRVLAERRIRAGGVDGFERDFAFTAYQGRLQMFYVGQRSVVLFAIWKPEVDSSKERADFFKSLTLDLARESAQVNLPNAPGPPNVRGKKVSQ